MKIIHYIESLGLGGGQVMMAELKSAIDKRLDCEQEIWLENKNKTESEFLSSYNITYRIGRIVDIPKVYRSTAKQPIVLLYHKLMSSNARLTTIAMRTVPVIVINHTHMGVRKPMGKCSAVVSVSEFMLKAMQKRQPQHHHVFIRNGVDQLYSQSVECEKKSDEFVTGRINRLCTIKHSDEWLKWCSSVELPKKMTHEYIGTGEGLEKGRKLLRNLSEPRNDVCLLGGIFDRHKKISKLKTWDIFLYDINENEGTSMSILEALSCGVPVICNDRYGNKEIIKNGVNGYVYKSKKEAQKLLSSLCLDDEKLTKLKISTIKHFAENLDSYIMADKYISLIQKVLDKNHVSS